MSARYVAAGHLRRGGTTGRVLLDPEFAAALDRNDQSDADQAACERLLSGRHGRQLLDSLVLAAVGEVQS